LDKEVKAIKERFDAAFTSDEAKERRKKMNRFLKEYGGELWDQKQLKPHDSKVMANFIFSSIQAKAPLLTDNKPVWSVKARRPYLQPAADRYTLAGDYLWDKEECEHKLFLAVKDCLLWPIGLWKIWFDPEKDDISIDVDDPRTFIIAPGYTDLWDCAWCGVKQLQPKSWIKSKYGEDVEASEKSSGQDVYGKQEEEGDFAWVYEVWLKDDTVVECMDEEGSPVLDDDGDKTYELKYPNGRFLVFTETTLLDDKESVYSHGKPPWVAFYDYKIPHSFWGIGEPDQIEELNREFNMRLQAVAKHAQKTASKNYVLDGGSGLDPDDVKETMDKGGNVYTVNAGSDQSVYPIDEGNLNPTHFQLLSSIPTLID
jgi:hypothetical protein